MTYYSQCLFYALDRWNLEGGGIVFVKSTHWFIPHVQHRSNRGKLTQFVPPHDLKANWHALFGFYGDVVEEDDHYRGKMTKRGMLVGSLLLIIFGAIWTVKKFITNLLTPIP